MNPHQRIVSARSAILIAMICGLAMMSVSDRSSAQQSRRNGIQRWEYCVVLHAGCQATKEKYVGIATICYFRSSGCRREEVVFELTYADFLKQADLSLGESYNRSEAAPARAAESALSKAITKLGNDGWEMVGDGRIDFSNNNVPKAIYFKRRTSH